MNLKGKRVLVTGASGGIGADLARELGGEGAELLISARRVPELEALKAELEKAGSKVTVLPGDLTAAGAADALAAAALATGPVDVLVNNAGVELYGRPWKEGMADRGERLLQLNLLAPLRLTHRLMAPMVERDDGALVFISSVAAWAPYPGGAYYAASKAGLGAFAEALRVDLKGTRVQVLAVYPGPVRTAMYEKGLKNEHLRRFFELLPAGTPAELARLCVQGLGDGEETIVYPAVYKSSQWLSGLVRRLVQAVAPDAKGSGR